MVKWLTIPKNAEKKIDLYKKEFNRRNGKNVEKFSIKEITLLFHKELLKKVENLEKKVDAHCRWSRKEKTKLDKAILDHDKAMIHFAEVLPEKGFCERVTNSLYTETGTDKVELLWNDRRWIKALLYAAISLTALLGGGNILLQLFG